MQTIPMPDIDALVAEIMADPQAFVAETRRLARERREEEDVD